MSYAIPKPSEIKEYLDKFVIGHEKPKERISVNIYNYLTWKDKGKNYIKHIVMIGETGTGKTLIAETLAKKIELPFADMNMKEFTEAGYVGEDVNKILYDLYNQAGRNLKKVEQRGAIAYLDEVDKLSSWGRNGDRGVNTIGVQESLLKMIGGHKVDVYDYSSKSPSQRPLIGQLDTSKILFIIGGAFDGITEIVTKDLKTGPSMGFGSEQKLSEKEIRSKIRIKHLIEYGMTPQFIGRFSTILNLDTLTKAEYKRILTEPEGNPIKVCKDIFGKYGNGIDLQFMEGALDFLAEFAVKDPTHARAIKTILDDLFSEDEYRLANSAGKEKLIVDENYIRKNLKQRIAA